jgi:hypothetical protein
VAATVCALLASSQATATRPNTTINPCTLYSDSPKHLKQFAEEVWAPDRWRRGDPPAKTIAAWRAMAACLPPGQQRALRKYWRELQAAYFDHRKAKRAAAAYLAAISPPGPDVLAAIRECESGGDYSTNTGNGFYGAFQFTLSTWASVGGSGLPNEASPREQDERAARLYRELGSGPWPVCGV